MKKTALVGVIIVAMAMMIGGQSAAKPAPVIFQAQGQVDYISFPGDFSVDGPAVGPWKVVLNLNTYHVSFTATCQTDIGVVKISSVGPALYSWDSTSNVVITITVNTMIVKNKGKINTYKDTDFPSWSKPHTIIIDTSNQTLDVDVYGNAPPQNLTGNVSKFKSVP